MTKHFILGIDIETTGLKPRDPNVLILEFGFAICFMTEANPEVYGETYLMDYGRLTGDTIGIQMAAKHGILDRITKGEGKGNSVDKLVEWLIMRVHYITGRNLLDASYKTPLLGKNLGNFDIQHLEAKCIGWDKLSFDHRHYDPGPMYLMPGDKYVPGMKTCCARAGIPDDVKHTAYADVVQTIELVHKRLGISYTKEVSLETMREVFHGS